jgi:hypothetical protein
MTKLWAAANAERLGYIAGELSVIALATLAGIIYAGF